MAWTVVKSATVFGNKRVVIMDVTTDAATQTVETGLRRIDAHMVSYQSAATGPNFVYANSNASGVQSMGVLGCSGFTSGDEMYIMVFGV